MVPSYHYRKYWTSDRSRWDGGSAVYKASGGRIINWPQQQLANGRGKNTAAKTGGGAALGAIIGALAGGGKGAAIGAVTGGGVGAGVNGVTRGQQVQIPSETLVSFHLQSPISVTTSKTVGGSRGDNPNQLQQRQ